MNNRRLARVIRRLQLRHVHNMPAHARRGNKAPRREPVQGLPVNSSALRLLAAEVQAGGARAEIDAVEVGADDGVVHGNGPVEHGARGPGDARVGDEDVQAAVEVADDGFDGGGDGLVGCDVDLVGAAWLL